MAECPVCGYNQKQDCPCGQQLDAFLKALHEELQQDKKTVLTVSLPMLGKRLTVHWNSA